MITVEFFRAKIRSNDLDFLLEEVLLGAMPSTLPITTSNTSGRRFSLSLACLRALLVSGSSDRRSWDSRSRRRRAAQAFDFAETNKQRVPVLCAVCKGREPRTHTQRVCAQGQKLCRQHHYPPLQKTQGRGTLCIDGAHEHHQKGGPPADGRASSHRRIRGERSKQTVLLPVRLYAN